MQISELSIIEFGQSNELGTLIQDLNTLGIQAFELKGRLVLVSPMQDAIREFAQQRNIVARNAGEQDFSGFNISTIRRAS